jgi:hypothetical protein
MTIVAQHNEIVLAFWQQKYSVSTTLVRIVLENSLVDTSLQEAHKIVGVST